MPCFAVAAAMRRRAKRLKSNVLFPNFQFGNNTIADAGSDWMGALEDRIDAERFCGQLPAEQRELIRMLQDGFQISEIADILNVSERDIRLMACEIARQRRKFDAEGVRAAGGEAELFDPGSFTAGQLAGFSAVAFGCPAMGCEVLEESEFEPMFTALEPSLGGKNIALFGSYGWGDGQWMRDWCDRCSSAGANLLDEDGLTVNEAPDEQGEEACRELGKRLAAW